ncbi:MAG: archaetidylserine decarboxylase [Hyphomicrobiaceae bacterium]
MTKPTLLHRISNVEWLNVALTNRIPRRRLTSFVGWLAKVEQPLIRDLSIAIWRRFSDLDLGEAKKTQFNSLHDCFIRELKDGARPIDRTPDTIVSPCDAIIGASGTIADGVMLQVKGSTYLLSELVRSPDLVAEYRNGTYVTLRLTASMYHRFHAPHDGRIERVAHIAGDTWNVNPPTLQRIPRVFCRNERAVIRMKLARSGQMMALVPVAAILVAGLKLKFMELPTDRQHAETWERPCDVPVTKGEELGWFEHGSTIIVLAPPGFAMCPAAVPGNAIRMGKPLLRIPS